MVNADENLPLFDVPVAVAKRHILHLASVSWQAGDVAWLLARCLDQSDQWDRFI